LKNPITTNDSSSSPSSSTKTNPSSLPDFLLSYPPDEHHRIISERLFLLIEKKTQPELAPKITGMLIDRFPNVEDLLFCLQNEEHFNQKITEALLVIKTIQ